MSKFYVVATPIGNLADISLRALEVFKSVDLILCEDTRVTSRLLKHYKIEKPLLVYHQHSGQAINHKVIESLSHGKDLALVTDAGTPGVQDPGNKLIQEILSHFSGILENSEDGAKAPRNISIIPIPGPSALTALASVSGLPIDSFLFLGFIPKKKGRQKILKEIVNSNRTVTFYESGHRVLKTLADLRGLLTQTDADSRKIVIGRELTKKFETIYRGTVEAVLEQLKNSSVKGEFVVMVAGK